MKTINFTVIRTAMIGGGTSYDVYVPTKYKKYRPIAFSVYATVIVLHDKEYYHLDDFLRTPTIDNLPALSDERSHAFKRLVKVARCLEFRVAKRAFPELVQLVKMPLLWVGWNEPSAIKIVKVKLHNHAHLCE